MSSTKPVVVSIIGGTIWGNRGAESMLVTVIGKLRNTIPDIRFNVFSYYPSKDRELVKDDAITILSGKPLSLITRHFIGAQLLSILKKVGAKPPEGKFFKVACALNESEILLDIGGITFSDGREKYLPYNILTIWPAMLLHVPVVKMAQAVGPFKHSINRLCAKIFLFRCEHIFARGERTAEFLRELGFPEDRFETVADIAFLYQQEFSLSSENSHRVDELIEKMRAQKKDGKKVLVISPSVLVEEESRKKGVDYANRFFQMMIKLGADEHFFVFLPNATRQYSEKSHNNDLLVIEAMKRKAAEGALPSSMMSMVEWVNYDLNSASIRRIISESHALITSRYHAMISGLSLCVPTIVIGWGHKYSETMSYFGLEHYSLDFGNEEISLEELAADILTKSDAIRKKIRSRLPGIQSLANSQFEYLMRILA